jgi:hypothetical protein
LAYLTNDNNLDYVLNYFVDSLSHIENIDLSSTNIDLIIEQVLDFSTWGKNFISSLRDYNTENIDFEMDQSV